MAKLIEIVHIYDDGSEAHFPVRPDGDSDAGVPSLSVILVGAGALCALLLALAVAM